MPGRRRRCSSLCPVTVGHYGAIYGVVIYGATIYGTRIFAACPSGTTALSPWAIPWATLAWLAIRGARPMGAFPSLETISADCARDSRRRNDHRSPTDPDRQRECRPQCRRRGGDPLPCSDGNGLESAIDRVFRGFCLTFDRRTASALPDRRTHPRNGHGANGGGDDARDVCASWSWRRSRRALRSSRCRRYSAHRSAAVLVLVLRTLWNSSVPSSCAPSGSPTFPKASVPTCRRHNVAARAGPPEGWMMRTAYCDRSSSPSSPSIANVARGGTTTGF
eukprot:CAMPEP_0181077956 /NCGR_PEP_ID=MMETSP1071-20121207/1231_1 /TAXON_ID=35127 /ORGANISM="Thalassiosira sp., Strain NH16" /LENGTH=277 /DNA_ID=CAMNT_0023159243 /DNA_START=367 /DNA_END=1199 /DNA_ORIENTATION=+